MRSSALSVTVQPALNHLNDLLNQTAEQPVQLQPLPKGVTPFTVRDVVNWACKGYDVSPAIRLTLSDPNNPRLADWGYSYARRLARRWVTLLEDHSPDALMQRWHGAVAELTPTHREYARNRLLDEVRKTLIAPMMGERDALNAVMQEPAVRRPRVANGR